MREIIYPEEYLTIIETASRRGLTKKSAEEQDIGVHGHHIIPKSVAPELANEKSNIVFLTYEEHYTAHKILAEANPDDPIAYAWNCMKINEKTKQFFSAEDYAEAMRLQSDLNKNRIISDETRRKMRESRPDVSGDKNPFYGKHHSDDARVRMSKNRPDVSGDKNVAKRKDVREKISKSLKGRKRNLKQQLGKQVDIFSADGTFENHFDCLSDAEIFYGVKKSIIGAAIRKRDGRFYVGNNKLGKQNLKIAKLTQSKL